MALIQLTDTMPQNTYSSNQQSKMKLLSFQWCNSMFEQMFKTQASVYNIDLKIFRSLGQPVVMWSLCDMIMDVHRKFLNQIGPMSGHYAVMKSIFCVTKPCTSGSSINVNGNEQALNMAQVKIKEVYERGSYNFFIFIEDLTPYLTVGHNKLISIFQTTLVNGLSYDKISNLKKMINLSATLMAKLKSAQNPTNQSLEFSINNNSQVSYDFNMEYKLKIICTHLMLMQMLTNSQIDMFLY